MPKITYKETSATVRGVKQSRVEVYLDNRFTGAIKPDGIQWRYYPKGGAQPGEAFQSIRAAQRSLES